MNFTDVWKTTEIQRGPLRLRRRVRLVTYIVGKDTDGNEVEFEVADDAAQAILDTIQEAMDGS